MVSGMLLALLRISALALALAPGLAATSLAVRAEPVTASAISVNAQDGDRVSLAVSLSTEPQWAVSVINTPARVIIDLAQTTLALPPPQVGGAVAAIRMGTLPNGSGRLVVELTRTMAVTREFYFPPVGNAPGRLILDLAPPGAATALAPANDPPTQADQANTIAERVVVIDPGHGGVDPGAVNQNGVMEKTVVLDFAKRLAARLEGTPGVRVELTRTDDSFLSFQRRIRIARAFGAELFISVHADAAPQDFVRGATVYTVAERPSDAQAAELAARENMADMVSGTIEPDIQEDVSGILASLLRQETLALSVAFADNLVAVMSGAVKMNNNPHRQARFRVLQAYDIPSVLLELGYLTNATDAEALTREDWQIRAADAVARAVAQFLTGSPTDAPARGG